MTQKIHLSALALVLMTSAALAQAIGGNASLSVTSASSNVAIPATASSYPALLIEPAFGTNAEVFYKFGASNAVAATTSSPALPTGGICLNPGPNTYLAAITASGTATLRLTQLTSCPAQVGGGAASATVSGAVTVSGTVGTYPTGSTVYSAVGGTGNALLTNSKVAVSTVAASLTGYSFDNTANTASAYVQFFDAASGSVTLGTTVPLFVVNVPAGGYVDDPAIGGVSFATAITVAVTTTRTGSTALGSGVAAAISYK